MRLLKDLAPGTVVRMPDWFYGETDQKQLYRILYHTQNKSRTVLLSETVFDSFADLHKAQRIYKDTYLGTDRYTFDNTFGTKMLLRGAMMNSSDGHSNYYLVRRPSRWLLGDPNGPLSADDEPNTAEPYFSEDLLVGRKPDGTITGYRLHDTYTQNGTYYYYCWEPGTGIVARTAGNVPTGYRPVYCVRQWTEVSEPDGDGICDILPVNTGYSPDGGEDDDPLYLGAHWEPFSFRYTLIGAGQVSVQFCADQPIPSSAAVVLSGDTEYQTFGPVSQAVWDRFPSGRHTVDISGTEYYFVKLGYQASFRLAEPVESAEPAATALIDLEYEIPETGSLTVEVTNNAFDEEPFWQDVTRQVIRREPIYLTNREKTADRWGYDVRVEVSRGNSRDGNCLIRRMKSNFK